jgi:sec-independent protein translocase protein TatB
VFNSVGWGEIALLVVIALFVFGPERLPKMAAEAGRMLRTLREMANNARSDLQAELGPELGDLDLASLNPKTFIRKNLFDDG